MNGPDGRGMSRVDAVAGVAVALPRRDGIGGKAIMVSGLVYPGGQGAIVDVDK